MFSKNMVLCKGNVGDSVVISVNLSVYFFRSFWNYFFCYLCYIPSINLFYTHTPSISFFLSHTHLFSFSLFISHTHLFSFSLLLSHTRLFSFSLSQSQFLISLSHFFYSLLPSLSFSLSLSSRQYTFSLLFLLLKA